MYPTQGQQVCRDVSGLLFCPSIGCPDEKTLRFPNDAEWDGYEDELRYRYCFSPRDIRERMQMSVGDKKRLTPLQVTYFLRGSRSLLTNFVEKESELLIRQAKMKKIDVVDV